ncbi:MAG: tetratricopeptide repeat protein [Planctomycetota bacterium]|jgi:tetratricopeptide (TPR) repeat protein
MTTENQQTNLEENTSDVPPDHELFAGEVPEKNLKADDSASGTHEELSEREIFAGDEDFYKFLADSTAPTQTTATESQHIGADASKPPLTQIRIERFSMLQKVLAASIIAIAAMLLYALLTSPPGSATDIATKSTAQQSLPPEPSDEGLAQVAPKASPQQFQQIESALPPTQPLSLKTAETFSLQKDYDKAYAVYNQLRQSLPVSAEEELLRDFLQLKMALCTQKAGDPDQADRLFRAVSESRSPLVRVIANYHRSLLEMQKKQYLKARTRAYQTIAIIGAVGPDSNWASSLERDCHFLAAESMTRNVISLCDADKDLPDDLWRGPNPSTISETDPFTNLNETQLRSLLNSGSAQLRKGLLSPRIQQLENRTGPLRFSVVCHGAPIEELLARFAANAGLDIHWAYSRTPTPQKTENSVRKRPVDLYMPAVTTQQFVTVTAGCAGLLARPDEEGTVNIYNPTDYSSLSEHIALLSQEAVSLWQRFLLAFHDDERIPNAHFAVGLLRVQRNQVTDAIAEYKLVANRFSQTSLAPFALLHSSKLKTNLHDYSGAREDLKQLVEQYPDTELAGQACLHLADATTKAGLGAEAGRLYCKAYYLGLPPESQTAAALGAGGCAYEEKDYETAAKWLTRYISSARNHPSTDLYSAYFLLGKTNLALGKPKQACDLLQYALAGQPSKAEYAEIVSELVKAHVQQEHFVEALDILENVRSWQLSQKELTEILLLKAGVLRTMGLVDKAIAALGDRVEYVPDPQLKARMSFELTKCYIAKGNLELVRRDLIEMLILVEPGPLAHQIALELADVCSKLDQDAQTISICLQLLDLGPSAQIKQKALALLAKAYNQQKNYDRAALALLGQWNGAEAPNEKMTFDTPSPQANYLQGPNKTGQLTQ